MGIISVFAAVTPMLLWLTWRMPTSSSEKSAFSENKWYYAAWMVMFLGHLLEWLIPMIGWLILMIGEYNTKVVKMYDIWLVYVTYYSHTAI